MKHILNYLLICSVLVIGAACNTLYSTTVTIQQMGDSISREYASLYNKGVITPEQHARAEQIHDQYRKAMGALGETLEAYKVNGNKATVATALRTAKDAIAPLINLIAPYIGAEKSTAMKQKLNNAVAQ